MKKCKIILFIILLTSILLAVSIIRKPEYPYNTTIEEYDGVIGLIDSETKIEQSFVSKIDSLDSIEIVFANYDNKITKGHLIAKIYNSDHQMIYLNKFNLSSLEDNKPIRFSFDIQKNCKGKRFYLEIDAKNLAKDEYVTLYSANEKDYILEESETIIKPIAIEQYGAKKGYYYTIVLTIILFIETLILFLVYYKIKKKKKLNKIIKNIFVIIISLLFASSLLALRMNIYYSNKLPISSYIIMLITGILILRNIVITYYNEKIEDIFLSIAIPIGTLFWISLIPGKVPDENWHMNVILQMLRGNFLQKKYDYKFLNKEIVSYKMLEKYIFNKNAIKLVTHRTKNWGYPVILYIPASIGVFIANMFKCNILLSSYIGSYFSFITFIIMGYYIIKYIPFCKLLMLIYLLGPINLQQCTSLSCDLLINMSSLLFISYILHIKFDKIKINFKESIIIAILLLYVLLSKYAYFPIAFMLLLIRKQFQFKANKKTIIPFIVVLIITAFAFVYDRFINFPTHKELVTLAIEGITAPQHNISKIGYLLSNPLNVFYLVFNTMHINLDFYILSYSGSALGWFDIVQPTYLSIAYYVIMILSVFMIKEKHELNKKEKIILLVIWLFNMAVVFGGLYMGWGEVRDIFVDGVQGRYFIPFNILLFIIMYNKKSFLDFKYNKLIALLTIFVIDFISVTYIMNFFLT